MRLRYHRRMRGTTLLLAMMLLGACHRGGGHKSPAAASAWDGKPQAFGAICETNEQCQSGACFVGGSQAYCSLPCTKESEATACPKPLTSGVCNKHNFCKRP